MRPDEFMARLERESMERTESVRRLLRDEGRSDLVEDFDRRMRDLDLGLTGARSAWYSISAAQRRALEAAVCGKLIREGARYGHDGHTFGLATLRALSARGLVHVDGPIRDPEAIFVITERGAFVLRHGQTRSAPYE